MTYEQPEFKHKAYAFGIVDRVLRPLTEEECTAAQRAFEASAEGKRMRELLTKNFGKMVE